MTLSGLRIPRKTFISDLISGMINGVVAVPDALANGLLAGVNPVFGVYSVIAGTPIAALFTSSVIMNVNSTSATAIATHEALSGVASDDQLGYLVILGVLVGLFMLTFGILKLGFLVRFISNSVMTGFLSGLGVLTILGQVSDLTGYDSQAQNKVFKLIDTIINWQEINLPTLILGLLTIVTILLLARTKLDRYSFLIAIVIITLISSLLSFFNSVILVGDTATIPRGLPMPNLPDLTLIPSMLLPALTITIIALVQASGVSQSTPNPDGDYPEPSRDFIGQGAANISTGIFGGISVGGSLSGTAMVQSIGGRSRWANIFTGIFAAITLVIFVPFIEVLPLTCLAGLLVVVGVSLIKANRLKTVWYTGPVPAIVMILTFTATLFLPLQLAVALGVILTFLLYVYKSAEKVRIEGMTYHPDGRFVEGEAPKQLPSGEVVILQPVGSLFFAGVAEFEEDLPEIGQAHHTVVIMRLRDRDEVGSTFIRALSRYAAKLQEQNNKIVLVGVNERVAEQLEKTKVLDRIGQENIYPVEPEYTAALKKAINDANKWISESKLLAVSE